MVFSIFVLSAVVRPYTIWIKYLFVLNIEITSFNTIYTHDQSSKFAQLDRILSIKNDEIKIHEKTSVFNFCRKCERKNKDKLYLINSLGT